MVLACIELRSAASPAALMSLAKLVRSGLWEAAVTAGSMLMPWKLPMPVAGTMPQSDPNRAVSAIAWCAMAWWDRLTEAAGAAEGALLPQAAALSARTPLMTPPVMAPGPAVFLVLLVRMVSPVVRVDVRSGCGPGPAGWPGPGGSGDGAKPRPPRAHVNAHIRYSPPAQTRIGS